MSFELEWEGHIHYLFKSVTGYLSVHTNPLRKKSVIVDVQLI